MAAAAVFGAIALVGAGVSAYGQIQAGNAQRKVGEANARIAELNADQAALATQDQLEQLSRHTGITLGKQTAGFAKAGVKRSGTALEVLNETVNLSERDANRLRTQGAFAQQGYLMEAENARYAGKVQQGNSRIGAGSSLLTSFGSVGLNYYSGKGLSRLGAGYGNTIAQY